MPKAFMLVKRRKQQEQLQKESQRGPAVQDVTSATQETESRVPPTPDSVSYHSQMNTPVLARPSYHSTVHTPSTIPSAYPSVSVDTPTIPHKRPEFWKKRCFSEAESQLRSNSSSSSSISPVITDHRQTTDETESPAKRQRLNPEENNNNTHRESVIKCVQNSATQSPVISSPVQSAGIISPVQSARIISPVQSAGIISPVQSDMYSSRLFMPVQPAPSHHKSYSPASSTCSDLYRSSTPQSDTSGKIRTFHHITRVYRRNFTIFTFFTL